MDKNCSYSNYNNERAFGEIFDAPLPSDNQTFINSVINKTQKQERKQEPMLKRKALKFAAVAAAVVILGAFTVSAAVSGGLGFLGELFGNNPKIIASMAQEIDYEVTLAMEGYDFEIPMVYTDGNSLFVAIDVIAENPVFDPEFGMEYEHENFKWLYWGIKEDRSMAGTLSAYVTDENHLTATFYHIDPAVNFYEGQQLTAAFYGDGGDRESLAEIKFTIGEVITQNDVYVYPGVQLENGNVLTEIQISPFRIKFCFAGERYDSFDSFEILDETAFKMKDGTILDVDAFWDGAVSNWDLEDDHGYTSVFFKPAQTFDVDDIEAVIYGGFEIALN